MRRLWAGAALTLALTGCQAEPRGEGAGREGGAPLRASARDEAAKLDVPYSGYPGPVGPLVPTTPEAVPAPPARGTGLPTLLPPSTAMPPERPVFPPRPGKRVVP